MPNPFGLGPNQSYANPIRSAAAGQRPNQSVSRSGGGGGRRRDRGGQQLTISVEEARRRDAEELARQQSDIQAQRLVEQTRQSRVEAGQLSSQVRKPTAREELLQMSIAEPRSRAGRLVAGIQTRETFIQNAAEESLVRQRNEFQALSEEQLFERSKQSTSGIVGMSTEEGSTYTFSFDEGKAIRQGQLAFATLPARERFKLLGGSAAAAGLKTGVGIAEFTLDIPLALLPGDIKTGRRVKSSAVFNRSETVREIKNLPGGGATLGFELAVGAGVGARALSGLITGTKGYTIRQKIGEAASLFSPIRPSPRIYGPRETSFTGKLTDIGIEGGGTKAVFTGKGKSAPEVEVVSYQVTPKGSTVGESATVITRPVFQFRGGELVRGRDTVFSLGRSTPKGSIVSQLRLANRPNVLLNFQTGQRTASVDISVARLIQFQGSKPILQRVRSDLTITGGSAGENILLSSQRSISGGRLNLEAGVFAAGLGTSPFKSNIAGTFKRIRGVIDKGDTGFSVIRGTGKRTARPSTSQAQETLLGSTSAQPLKSLTQNIARTSSILNQGSGLRVRQSAYYGMGLYERTEAQSVLATRTRSVSQRPSAVLLGNQFMELSDERPRLVLGLITPTRTRSRQGPRQIPLTIQGSGLSTGQKTRQGLAIILTGKTISPRTSFPRSFPPYRPPIYFPNALGLGSTRGRGSLFRGSFSPRYTASLTSSTFGLFGKVPKRYRSGEVDPFGRRVIPLFSRKTRKKRRKG